MVGMNASFLSVRCDLRHQSLKQGFVNHPPIQPLACRFYSIAVDKDNHRFTASMDTAKRSIEQTGEMPLGMANIMRSSCCSAKAT